MFSHHNVVKTNQLYQIPITIPITNRKTIDIKVEYHADDDVVFCDDHKMAETDINALNEANNSPQSGLSMHPNKTEILVISKQKYKTSKTTKQDCIDHGTKRIRSHYLISKSGN